MRSDYAKHSRRLRTIRARARRQAGELGEDPSLRRPGRGRRAWRSSPFRNAVITGYWFLRHLSHEQIAALAEPLYDGPSCQELMRLSKQYGLTIGAGMLGIESDGRLFKPYVIAMPNGEFRHHRKLHPFVASQSRSGPLLHRLRYAARLPRRRADLLRLQYHRERPHQRADGRGDPPGARTRPAAAPPTIPTSWA